MESMEELDKLFEQVYRESIGECHIVIKNMDSGLFSYLGQFNDYYEAQAFIDNLGINAIVISCDDLRSCISYVEEENRKLGSRGGKVEPNPSAINAASEIEEKQGLKRCEAVISNAGVDGWFSEVDDITGNLNVSVTHDGGPLLWHIPPKYNFSRG